ncbi:MAG: histidine kinase dimerization/phospho-acceptor domain-containing protein [Planctomycetota bacterium]
MDMKLQSVSGDPSGSEDRGAVAAPERTYAGGDQNPSPLLEAVAAIILLLDETGHVRELHVPRRAGALDGLRGRPRPGMHLRELLPPAAAAIHTRLFPALLDRGTPQQLTYRLGDKHLQALLQPASGGGVLLSLSDCSELRGMEDRLQAAEDEAQIADRTKSAFLAHMGHDIRTPMAAALANLDMLRRSDLDRRQREHVELAYHSTAADREDCCAARTTAASMESAAGDAASGAAWSAACTADCATLERSLAAGLEQLQTWLRSIEERQETTDA